MAVVSLIWGILAALGMVVAFVPCLGALNWLTIPFAGFGVILGGIALATADRSDRGSAVGGLVCSLVAVFVGLIRLVLGGGIL